MRNNYGFNAVQATSDYPDEEFSYNDYREIFRLNPNMRSVTSHKLRYPCPVAHKDMKYIAFFRDPAQRIMSQYYFLQQITNKDHFSHLSFNELYEELHKRFSDQSVKRFINGQVRYIAKADDLEKAKYIINTFTLAGVVERFDESMLLFKQAIEPEKN